MSAGLRSWGRYPNAPQVGHHCNWQDELPGLMAQVAGTHGSTLPYGNGRSYGDSCLAASDQVLHLRSLDRFIEIDWRHGIVRAEAGVTLGEILKRVLPLGWFLSVTPGTQFVTLGGAIANDVHGKNHHRRGTFGKHVRQLGLLRHGEGLLTCSAEEKPALFGATIGGLGLTGVIAWAEIQLMPVHSTEIQRTAVRFGSLAEFFALSSELDHQHEYSAAWIDCAARGAQLGRGAYFVGDHAHYGDLWQRERAKIRVPMTPPASLIGSLSVRLFNEAYWRRQPTRLTRSWEGYEPFLYPLDRILEWNRVYGPKGFQQYQCVIPDAAAEDAMTELLAAVAAAGRGSFLAVLKRCGDLVSPGLLSFPLPGTSLALDFPQHADLAFLFGRLDAIVREAGGRLYPAKDAHMSASDFRAAYPAWEQLEAQRDPVLLSKFWARVIGA